MKSEWSEKVFDAFVQEVVTGQHPPDLTARITDAWQRQRVGDLPSPPIANASSNLVVPPIAMVNSSSPSMAEQRSPKLHGRNLFRWSTVLFVAASILLVIAGLQLRNLFISVTDANNSLANSTDKQVSPVVPSETDRKETIATRPPANNGETLSLDGVPFATQDLSKTEAEARRNSKPSAYTTLNDQQMVELIDTQLIELWKRMKLVPADRVSDEELAQAISRTLTGQDLPVATAAQLVQSNSVQRREKVIATAMDSNAFARRWADRFVGQWLRGGNLALDSEPVEKLERFVASGITDERPWNEVIAQVVAGNDTAGDAFAAALAGGDNHRLAGKLSSQFMDSSLACARCHASTTAGSVVQTQDEYWSLVALLVGIDVSNTSSPVRKSVDKQLGLFANSKVPSLFFERPDGTLEAAKFVLPDGRPWQSIEGQNTPRGALAQWLGQSQQADRAAVDQVWQFVFGHPLVGSHPLMNDVGREEREDLLQLMAQQFRAHGRNLSQLVGWVIRSDAFSRSQIAIDQNRWLQAKDEDIAQWHVAEMTFAAKTSLGNSAAKSGSGLEGSLASSLKWNQSTGVDTRVLAQPNLNPKAKPSTPVKSDVLMPTASYIVHRGRVSAAQQEFLDRLLASEKLSWKQKVEHVVSLSPGLTTNNRVVQLTHRRTHAAIRKDPRTLCSPIDLWQCRTPTPAFCKRHPNATGVGVALAGQCVLALPACKFTPRQLSTEEEQMSVSVQNFDSPLSFYLLNVQAASGLCKILLAGASATRRVGSGKCWVSMTSLGFFGSLAFSSVCSSNAMLCRLSSFFKLFLELLKLFIFFFAAKFHCLFGPLACVFKVA